MLLDLKSWIESTYKANPPALNTVRRWCREGKLFPPAVKHGRNYYLQENARYCDNPRLRGVYAQIERQNAA